MTTRHVPVVFLATLLAVVAVVAARPQRSREPVMPLPR